MDNSDDLAKRRRAPWRNKWNEIIFGDETPAGRFFDVVLLIVILLSVLTVLLESVPSIQHAYGTPLFIAEWIFTALFTVEYAARLATATNAGRYARSFFGIVDLLAVAPIYLSFFFGFTHSFSVLRSLRYCASSASSNLPSSSEKHPPCAWPCCPACARSRSFFLRS